MNPFLTNKDANALIASLRQQVSEAGLPSNVEEAKCLTNKDAQRTVRALLNQLGEAGHEPKLPEETKKKLDFFTPGELAKATAQAQAKLDAKNASARAAEAAKKLRAITAASKAEREKAEASKTTPAPAASQPASNLFGFDRVVAHYQAHATKTVNR